MLRTVTPFIFFLCCLRPNSVRVSSLAAIVDNSLRWRISTCSPLIPPAAAAAPYLVRRPQSPPLSINPKFGILVLSRHARTRT